MELERTLGDIRAGYSTGRPRNPWDYGFDIGADAVDPSNPAVQHALADHANVQEHEEADIRNTDQQHALHAQ